MGWADCGDDSRGRRIGYAWSARCDHVWGGRKCSAKIDRGLAYACGGMHGENGDDCEGYFCPKHLYAVWDETGDVELAKGQRCRRCAVSIQARSRWQK
jgi:hypothetical protein